MQCVNGAEENVLSTIPQIDLAIYYRVFLAIDCYECRNNDKSRHSRYAVEQSWD